MSYVQMCGKIWKNRSMSTWNRRKLVTPAEDSEPVDDTIMGWLACVQEKTSLQPISAKASDTSTSVFKLSSQPSKARTDAGITMKFGGFDLDCDEDNDNEEQEVTLRKEMERMNKNTALVIPFTLDSDFEIEASQIPPWYDSYKGTPSPSQPWMPLTILRSFEMKDTPPPSQPWVPLTMLKRKIEEAPNRNPSEDEDLLKLSSEFGMEVDTANLTSQQTSVSVVHTDDDAQLMAKKVKMEADDISLGKKTKALEHKSCSVYKNIDPVIMADQKWTSVFMDTIILWAGGQTSIWSIPNETLATSLQEIISIVYPDIEHKVSQCLLKWHSGSRSTALIMVIYYFWEMIENSINRLKKAAVLHST
ncbi:hypothetical protein HD554DRAFT_2035686 [Boletus coccyginus]|nr:hypothetical protein HD554DRAFT_2035686 [Boletus coccyginus]